MSPLLLQEVGQLIKKLNDHMYWMIQRSDLHPFLFVLRQDMLFFPMGDCNDSMLIHACIYESEGCSCTHHGYLRWIRIL